MDKLYDLLEELRQMVKGNKQAELLVYKISITMEELKNEQTTSSR